MALTDTLTLLGTEPGSFSCYVWKNVTITVWTGQATAPAVERLSTLTDVLRKRHPNGTSSIHVVQESSKLPEAGAREGLTRLMNEHGDWLAGIAVVIAGSGFWASTMRSVVTALRVLSPRTFDLRIHGSLEEVVEWIPAEHSERTGIKLDPERLLSVLRQAYSGN